MMNMLTKPMSFKRSIGTFLSYSQFPSPHLALPGSFHSPSMHLLRMDWTFGFPVVTVPYACTWKLNFKKKVAKLKQIWYQLCEQNCQSYLPIRSNV